MIHLTPEVQNLIDQALAEDQTFSDPTTHSLIPHNLKGVGLVRAKSVGVLAGVDVSLAVFRRVDPRLCGEALMEDGASLVPGDSIARVEGSAASILRAERPALNFLQRMSGIATDTARYVKAVEGLKSKIVDTRKTVPGLRYLDKYAVRAGGGANHRMNLADGILIKDNHIAALRSRGLNLKETVLLALERASHTVKVEVEVTNLEELGEALEAGAHIIMLDNMSLDTMRQGVEMVNGRAILEASGGINLETARAVAETGVDLISIGGLTHSVKALDISLDLEFNQEVG
ncbi:MAG: carboxylating nicotinate-nucleotide diphosphorylase [Dehalococcoidia bacterium]|nr:carboxylating nicotinate-nucleotide diphosphorylase [Dehalococcoidia bacterium]